MDHLAGYPPTVELLRTLHDSGEELCVCSVVVAEVYSGLRPEAILQARLLLDGLRYLETPEPAARLAGAWRTSTSGKGCGCKRRMYSLRLRRSRTGQRW
jgi:predicted nucleic acid-binding protein